MSFLIERDIDQIDLDEYSLDSATDCTNFLAVTDIAFGLAKSQAEILEKEMRIVKGQEFLRNTGTKDERESKAYNSEAYKAVFERYKDAVTDRDILCARRLTAETKLRVWQTHSANKRQGSSI